MLSNVLGATQQYLADVGRNQSDLLQVQQQITSGIAVSKPSDNPAALPAIFELQSEIAGNQQIQNNLAQVKTEVNTADSVLQTAIQAVQNAANLASQGASSTTSNNARAMLANQIAGIQQTLVGIAQTTVNGRYIFSGDQDSQAPYALDSTQPEGVQQLITGTSTRSIRSVDGTTFAVALTAQQIFDPRNPDTTPATGNVFAAIQNLATALASNNTTAITAAAADLQTAGTFLNGKLAFYGDVENRVQTATDLATKFQTQEQTQLSGLRDTDIPTAATQLTQLQNQQQASMQVEANILQIKSLFSYLA